MIEDTSFVIDVLSGDDAALELLSTAEAERRPEKVSSVTLLELYEGIEQSTRPGEEQEQVLKVLDSKTVIDADASIMRRVGEISGTLTAGGEPIDREDCIVAATALQEDEPVVTRNIDHFERVPGVGVREY
jgi:predicted nucleic acid-binding protein